MKDAEPHNHFAGLGTYIKLSKKLYRKIPRTIGKLYHYSYRIRLIFIIGIQC